MLFPFQIMYCDTGEALKFGILLTCLYVEYNVESAEQIKTICCILKCI